MIKRVRLYLVRHGHVLYFDEQNQPINPKYAPLSDRGRFQIRQLAKQLAESIQIDHIYCSTMPRSIETAKLLAKYQSVKEIKILDDLREIKAGRLKEIHAIDAKKIIHGAYRQNTHRLRQFLNGESWQDFEKRILPSVEEIIKNHLGQQVLISSHDAVNRLIIAWAYGQVGQDLNVQEQHYGALNIIDVYVKAQKIIEKRIILQNYTPYNLFKEQLHHNAVEDVYQMYLKTNGFQENPA